MKTIALTLLAAIAAFCQVTVTGPVTASGPVSSGSGSPYTGSLEATALTSGVTQGFTVLDNAGQSVLYILPPPGSPGQFLTDAGAVACPTLDPSSPVNLCHQLAFVNAPGGGGSGSGNTISQNLCSSLPPTSGQTAGNLFKCTDAPVEFLFDGTKWQPYAFGSQVSLPPSQSTLTWTNQGTATKADQNGGLFLTAPANSADNVRAAFTSSYPTTPYTFTVGLLPTAIGANYSNVGIALSDGTKLFTCHLVYNTGFGAACANWNSTTSFGAVLGGPYPLLQAGPGLVYITVADDGANLTGWISTNPYDLKRIQIGQESRTSWMSGGPTKIGVFLDVNNATWGMSALILHWAGI